MGKYQIEAIISQIKAFFGEGKQKTEPRQMERCL